MLKDPTLIDETSIMVEEELMPMVLKERKESSVLLNIRKMSIRGAAR